MPHLMGIHRSRGIDELLHSFIGTIETGDEIEGRKMRLM
jgi:hypothetical protein